MHHGGHVSETVQDKTIFTIEQDVVKLSYLAPLLMPYTHLQRSFRRFTLIIYNIIAYTAFLKLNCLQNTNAYSLSDLTWLFNVIV